MLSLEAERVRQELIKNKDSNFEYALNVPLDIQRKEWEDSASKAILPQGIQIEKVVEKKISESRQAIEKIAQFTNCVLNK